MKKGDTISFEKLPRPAHKPPEKKGRTISFEKLGGGHK
mgnify:CR=1 FL=1